MTETTGSGLPMADAETRAFFLDWLDTFASHVRAVDYAPARPLFHPSILAFGTHQDVLPDREAWIATQWDNVWPKTSDFRFTLDAAQVLASDDVSMAVVIAPWTSTGYHPDGSAFDRPGRATMVFHRKPDGGWIGVHTHLSLNRGVPQTSHANRPVKSR
ncbi:YybH family protein [Rhodopila sp.]|jgi:ketosteroid isomerase-like protein|uniref:YybH family protein n=1 Tax=Rhodopila sp. TaxID=2480087 RepID=UPI002CFC03A6|nr:nuclear transport factor 2 family protein [Rhodopila sp.]HVZ07738.1 nuclear transport factor 2 family protein [Rhodopila sp.]